MADYSELLSDDLWFFIGKKFEDAADCIRFRSVCRRWRSILPFPQPPWLMLAEDDNAPNTRGFFGLGQSQQQNAVDEEKQEVYRFQLPEAYQARCVGSTGTWLITIDLQQRIRLLNPLSRVHIDLPPQPTLEFCFPHDADITPQEFRDAHTYKAIMCSPPSSGRDCVVVLIFYHLRKLAYARPGDAVWTTLPTPMDAFEDIIFYKNQIYGYSIYGYLIICSFGDDLNPPIATIVGDKFKREKDVTVDSVRYLVEWMGELLLVIKYINIRSIQELETISYGLNRFEIYKFDFEKKMWNELNNLGEYSLFLGHNTSIAVLAAQYPGLKKNCIYFTEDYKLGFMGNALQDGFVSGVVDLEDNSVRPHYKGNSTSNYSPPLWIIPWIYPQPGAT